MAENILIVAPLDGGTSLFIARALNQLGFGYKYYPYRTYTLEQAVQSALERLNLSSDHPWNNPNLPPRERLEAAKTVLGEREITQSEGVRRMNEDLLEAASEFDATLVLKGEFIQPETFRTLRQRGERVALWNFDPRDARQTWVLDRAREVEWYFTIAKGEVTRYREEGIRAHWLLEAADPEIHAPGPCKPEDPHYPISFVGTIEDDTDASTAHDRESWLKKIDTSYPGRLHIFGSKPGNLQGPRYHGRAEQAAATHGVDAGSLKRSPDVGLSWVTRHTTINLGRDRNPTIERSYGARLFRTLAAGGYLVTNRTWRINDDFPACLDTYANDEECLTAIQWALDHPETRKRMAERGRELVLAKHTWRHRITELLHVMGIGSTGDNPDDNISA